MITLTFLLLACDSTEDDTATDDTGTDSTTPVSLDALVAGPPDSQRGCNWSYSTASWGDTWVVADLALPDADRYAAVDVTFDQAIAAEDELTIGTGTGTGEVAVFDCGDLVDVYQGVQQWDVVSGTFTLEATFEGDHPEWTCDSQTPNPVYDGVLTFFDLAFVDPAGNEATATSIGPLDIRLGQTVCGG